MPKRKKKPKPSGPTLMDRTRAAVRYANTTQREDDKMSAFMALFHPEVSDSTVRELVREVKAK